MRIDDFQIEQFFALHEFSVPHHLSASDCESLTVAEVLSLAGESPESLLSLSLGYTESRGDPRLRATIADFYPDCVAEDVLVTNAPEEAIFVAMNSLLSAGDRVIVQTPCYQSLFEIARSIGCEVVPWPLRAVGPRWLADLDELERLLPGARLLVINAPQNPTGHHPERAEFESLAERARHHGVRVFCDEMYRGLEPDPELSLPPMASLDPRGISLWGMSKTFGLPGLRIGWLVCRERELLDRMARFKDYTTICSSAPGELLARLALTASETIAGRSRQLVAANRDVTAGFMARYPDLMTWLPPRAGPVSLARLHGQEASEFCRLSREQANVLLVPSRVFAMDDTYVRLGLGRAGYAEALGRLEQWLER